MGSTPLASLTELAGIANVSRQAVWNWSKRKADFPAAVSEGPNGPVYSVAEFTAWLEQDGKTVGGALKGSNSVATDLLTADPKSTRAVIEGLSAVKKKKLRQELMDQIRVLQELEAELDAIKQPEHIFDPSNPNYMGRFTAAALLIQPRHPLEEVEKFYGAGVYALYYKGEFAAYEKISGKETPLYTGKADPKFAHAENPTEQGDSLSRRINEHRKSIELVSGQGGISLEDFEVRYLVTASGFQVTAENFLISYFKPIWNKETKICFGIGKHGDDANTRKNKKSPWDTLHPGRKWALASEELKTPEEIAADISDHLDAFPPIDAIDFKSLLLGEA
ncbi:Eco29kI family restriction endonuclease [uncultured Ruegeria sp.]|uniref:Eco29kI family restriction endonuclease n=1 Tax=uncultured Ruegeria sp. TaxID=259304 RepID=UPI00261E5C81|nr:Eco29kI family restriction endonuclease [uncultured Ruegeria sp.]